MSFLEVRSVCAGYGRKKVVENITFSLEKGEILGLLGANGSGKTTLIQALCGNLPHSGTVTLEGVSLEKLSPRPLARLCSYIPQRSGISIDMSALEVVAMGFHPYLGLLEQPGDAQMDRAKKALSQVGPARRGEENFQTLSEGQKQLVILARTLVGEGKLLLLDEPESALDISHRWRMAALLQAFCADKCAVLALHDPQLALNLCHRVLLLKDGKSLGVLRPRQDSLEDTEKALSQLYGPVTLGKLPDKRGNQQFVILKDWEEMP